MSTKRLLVDLFVMLWVVAYGGLSFAEDKSKYRYPDLDTPFIAEFRERYEANPKEKFRFIIDAVLACTKGKRYGLECGKRDIENMKLLAEKGDNFSLATLSFSISMSTKYNVDKQYYERLALEHNETVTVLTWPTKQKLDYLVSQKEYLGFIKGMSFLFDGHDTDEFCRLARKSYEIFGIEGISKFLVFDDNESAAFLKCGIFPKNQNQELILRNINSEESQLILTYRMINANNVEKSVPILETLYKSDNKIVRANAEYCLGVMIYQGRGGFKADKKRGVEMLKSAYNEGIITAIYPLTQPISVSLPKNKFVTIFGANTCGVFATQSH